MKKAKNMTLNRLIRILKLPYHYLLAFLGAVIYRFPSRKIQVIAVTGTKGKSSVVELVNGILEEAGFKTALANTIRFKIGEKSERNLHKMTMPGRFFLQNFLRKAVQAGCTHAVIEMTSEGARQFRHKFIGLDALIFTNLAPEHIESHGSYENYVAAKVSLAEALEKSPTKSSLSLIPPLLKEVPESARAEDLNPSSDKNKSDPFNRGRIRKVLLVNGEDKESPRFLEVFTGEKVSFSRKDAKNSIVSSDGVAFEWNGVRIESKLPGEFNLCNILAAASFAKAVGVSLENIKSGIEKVTSIRGRAEEIVLDNPLSIPPLEKGGRIRAQDFTVIVDYAHTPDSLEKFYQTYAGKYKRCILGNTGGGRDVWKRPVMAEIAEKYCDEIILTNEDPYDEDPEKIIREMAAGMKHKEPILILDRRVAIRRALESASKGDVVLITGKGTDPYIMGPNGGKMVWDDAAVVREELKKLLGSSF